MKDLDWGRNVIARHVELTGDRILHCAMLIAMIALVVPSNAQRPTKSISLEDEVADVAIDRPGDLYATLRNGKIFRVDAEGNVLPLSGLSQRPTLFDPRDGSRLFAYYRETQRYAYFSMSREMSSHQVDSAFAISPWLICPSGDHNVWIADAADNSIRKVNNATSRIDAEIRFEPGVSAIRYMREYQGFLFVLHPARGIIVFSSMGKELRTIGTGQIAYFNFLGEELYYPDGAEQLTFFNLFNADNRSVKLQRKATFSLLTDTRVFSIQQSRVEIFQAPR
ncbi:MAG: hypothetical protein QM762_30325 [Chryseolinea sp.]